MLNKGNCDLNIDNEESYNDNLGLIFPKDYSLIKVFILLAFFIIIIDFALADYGEWDPCKKIRVGTTKLWIDLRYGLHDESYTGNPHMHSPCDSTKQYYFDFEHTLIFKRVKVIHY